MKKLLNPVQLKWILFLFIFSHPFTSFSQVFVSMEISNNDVNKSVKFNGDTIVVDRDSLSRSSFVIQNFDTADQKINWFPVYDEKRGNAKDVTIKAKSETTLNFDLAKAKSKLFIVIRQKDDATKYSIINIKSIPKPKANDDLVNAVKDAETNSMDTVGEFRIIFDNIYVYEDSSRINKICSKNDLYDSNRKVVDSIDIEKIRISYKRGQFNIIAYKGNETYASVYSMCTDDYAKSRFKDFTRLTYSANK